MIAEAEVEKLRNEINTKNNSTNKEFSSDKINELNGQIKLLMEKYENLLQINNEYEVELRDKSEKLKSVENNLDILKNENENLGKLLNDLIITKDKVIESVKKVTEENRYLHSFLHEQKEISKSI
jgi:chromosome segregation ATPase